MHTDAVFHRNIRQPEAAGRRARLEAARLNPLTNAMLAFWAIWHCRHARPPLRVAV